MPPKSECSHYRIGVFRAVAEQVRGPNLVIAPPTHEVPPVTSGPDSSFSNLTNWA